MGTPDLGEIRGDPWAIRGCATDVRSVMGSLAAARTAAASIETALGGSSWSGEAYAALMEQQPERPSSADIDNAGRVLERAASVLDTLAGQVESCQERLAHCRARLSALVVDGDVPDEQQAEVDRIVRDADEVHDDHRRARDAAAGAFDEMDDQTVYAEPPPGLLERAGDALGAIGRFTADFVVGIVEGVVEIVKGIAQLAYYLGTPMGWMAMWQNRDQILAVVQFAIDNPGEFFTSLGQAIVDWDTLKENPARWLGKLVPNILLAVATGGAGAAAGRTGALAARLTRFPRAASALNRVASGAYAIDRVGGAARVVPALRRGTAGLRLDLRSRPTWLPAEVRAGGQKLDDALAQGDVRYTVSDRSNEPSAKKLWEEVNGPAPSGMDIDHTKDLQLGGETVVENLRPLSRRVNRSLGPQIDMLLSGRTGSRGLPYPLGTPIVEMTLTQSRLAASATWVGAESPWVAWSGTAAAGAGQLGNVPSEMAGVGSAP